VITITELSKNFGSLKAVDRLSFQVNGGEVFGLLGPNGAGKSTTVKMMVGMLSPSEGEIEINGQSVKSDINRIKADLGYVPENCALYENLTGREHLEMVCNLHHFPLEKIEPQATKLIELFELKDSADKRIAGYSKGMKQRLLLAGAIIHNPSVLILDEPLSGLDANAQSLIRELISEFARSGKTVIFCSHTLEVVERLCDRLIIIDHGKKLTEGTPAEILAQVGVATLGEAFNQLTGATDIDSQAKGILKALDQNER
jgi:ABC-2 type transport system ATP-binding protein